MNDLLVGGEAEFTFLELNRKPKHKLELPNSGYHDPSHFRR